MIKKEFPNFAEWKEEIKSKEKTKLTDQQLLSAYVDEKENYEALKRQREASRPQ